MAGVAGLGALALAQTPTVPPPSRPGPWHQLGAAIAGRPGKALHFYRTAQNPQALGFVVRSSSSRSIHVFWSSYCEVYDDDTMTEEHMGTLDGVGLVSGYPPVLAGATYCYVWVNAGAPGKARLAAAEFEY